MDQAVTPTPESPSPSAKETPPASPWPPSLIQNAMRFIIVLLISWIAASLPFPYSLATLPLAVAASTLCVLALVATIKVPQAMLMRLLLVVGGMVAGMLALTALRDVILIPELMDHRACMNAAITHQGQMQCEQDLTEAVSARFPGLMP